MGIVKNVLTVADGFVTGWSDGTCMTIGTGMLAVGIKSKELDKKTRAYLIMTGGSLVYTAGKSYVKSIAELCEGVKELIADRRKEEEDMFTPYVEET